MIEDLLRKKFYTDFLCVEDNSCLHKGHAGAKDGVVTHISISLKSAQLRHNSMLNVHREVYSTLSDVAHLHAISINIIN